jgi:CubicO group peptidase (beta-lactamase class C family)
VSPTDTKTGNAGRASVRIDEAGLEAKVAEVLDCWPSAGLAAGMVRGGTLAWFLGHGVADIESKEPITQALLRATRGSGTGRAEGVGQPGTW